MITRSQVDELRRFNARVVSDIPRELRALEASVRGLSPETVRDALLDVAPAIADRHGSMAAAGSAEWYEQVRRSEVGGSFAARPGALPERAVIEQNVRYAAGALFVDQRVSPFTVLEGSLSRHVLDVGRRTIRSNVGRDRQAVGWSRMAQGDGCDFCVMLAGRPGAVYKKQTADFASHDNCRCYAAPSWDRGAPEMPVRAYEASQSTSGMSPARQARHRRNITDWLSSNRDTLDDLRSAIS